MKFTNSLSFKIIIALFSVLAVVLSIITYYNINVQSEHLFDTIQLSAIRSSDFIKKSLHYSMMKNHRDDLWYSIINLGSEPGVERIRIYNKIGVIMFSTKQDEVGMLVDKNAEACIMCHGISEGFHRSPSDQFARVYEGHDGHRILGLINPIKNERTCIEADCHAHSKSETVLGVLDVQMSLATFDTYITKSSTTLVASSIITLIAVVLVSAGFILLVVQRPIKKFVTGTNVVASGNLDFRILLDTRDELGELAISFNSMIQELRDARTELTEWSETLVEKVEEKTRELQHIQAQIMHMEKMASLGKLSASIAHELNNPLSGILTFARLIRKQIQDRNLPPEKMERVLSEVSMIADEAKRCGEIVKDLLFFSRKQSLAFGECDIVELVEKSISLVQHRLDLQQITLVRNFAPDPVILACDGSRLHQAFVALIVNAIEAMAEGGTLTLAIDSSMAETVQFTIADTGCGISPSDLGHIFEPFYTTKAETAGVGLGLAIVYGIVQNHGGTIEVKSSLDVGTTFTITIPRHAAFRSSTSEESQ